MKSQCACSYLKISAPHNLLSVHPSTAGEQVPGCFYHGPLFILECPSLLVLGRLPFRFGYSRPLQVLRQPRLPHLLPSPFPRRHPCRLSGHPAAPRNVPDKFHHLHTWADDLDRESRHSLLIAQPQTCSLSSSGILGSPEIRSAPILRRGPISLSSHTSQIPCPRPCRQHRS